MAAKEPGGRGRGWGFGTGNEPRIASAVAIGFSGSEPSRTLATEPGGWRGTAAPRGSRAVRQTVRRTPSLLSAGECCHRDYGQAIGVYLRRDRGRIAT